MKKKSRDIELGSCDDSKRNRERGWRMKVNVIRERKREIESELERLSRRD